MKLSQFSNTKDRRDYIAQITDTTFHAVEKAAVDDEADIHCENLIGATSIPLGVAGPIRILGDEVDGSYYVPLATTEGALVASVNRGARAVSESGGVRAYVYKTGATRGPVFFTQTIAKGQEFIIWLEENLEELISQAESTSNFLSLVNVEGKLVGSYVYVRFYFDTQEAMGMNMATIATTKMVEYIEAKSAVKCIAVAGNFDVDKKAAWLNTIYGRGYQVWADVVVGEKVLKSILKVDAQQLFDTWLAKCMIGSAIAGSMSFNAHYANVVAGIYAATGQDLAHIVEGSLGITTMRIINNKDIYISVYLPSLMLGTIGGGMKLSSKQEALSIIGVETAHELAYVVGASVLAGEISLLASLSEGSLAAAHARLGR